MARADRLASPGPSSAAGLPRSARPAGARQTWQPARSRSPTPKVLPGPRRRPSPRQQRSRRPRTRQHLHPS
eukprot:1366549-Alexandrium_andersonii.AAC.1